MGMRPSGMSTCLISRASSTGRCNTVQCIGSAMLPRENHLFGRSQSKPSQGSVQPGLAQVSDFSFCFQCKAGSSLVLRRPIETTSVIGNWLATKYSDVCTTEQI